MPDQQEIFQDTGQRPSVSRWGDVVIDPGETKSVDLAVSQSYSGMTVQIPIQVKRGKGDGPVIFVSAALHGDEINGTGAIRNLILDPNFELEAGSLILVPVMNILGFDRNSRYLPDRRDLNRCFPGSSTGTLASRMAKVIFDEIVARADFGIDLHTAAVRRTNYPTVRGDLSIEPVADLAQAFGCEIILDKAGPEKALRREACAAGCPTIIMEGGEVWKVEPAVVGTAVRGIRNVLRHFGMISGRQERPDYQVEVSETTWVRANNGGFLRFHVAPGAIVEKDQPVATNTNLLGEELGVIFAPFDSIVIGMTTLPAISPGEPACHLARLPAGMNAGTLKLRRDQEFGLEEQLQDDLSSSVTVVERTTDEEE